MPFELPPLPYAMDALVPVLSKETLEYHYGKHHRGYVDKLNELLRGSESSLQGVPSLIKTAKGPIFNNAAQIWNHTFYWNSMLPPALKNSDIVSPLLEKLSKTFGSLEGFKTAFKEKAISHFGSGWTWLIKKPDGSLEILNTSNAENPLTTNNTPLLVCDVWEHAYYIDYRNARAKYVEAFLSIVNWDFVNKNYLE